MEGKKKKRRKEKTLLNLCSLDCSVETSDSDRLIFALFSIFGNFSSENHYNVDTTDQLGVGGVSNLPVECVLLNNTDPGRRNFSVV